MAWAGCQRWLTTSAFVLLGCLRQAHARPEPRVSYELAARLLPNDGRGFSVEGRGKITIDNQTPRALVEVPWHLYMNAFREDNASKRDPFLDGRAAQTPGSHGSIDVTRLVDARDHALQTLEEDGDVDPTTATLKLTTPILPGQRASFEVEWKVSLPRLSQRTGYAGDFVFAGQWFPKVAKLEPSGSWTQFAFHPQSEFYANFGDYDVTLDVPKNFLVGASGSLTSSTDGERRVVRYQADGVHDFAWVAWPDFEERTELIEGVTVRLLMPAGQEQNAALTWRTLRFALPWLNEWLGSYPLPTLTVVHPPPNAVGAGGMEYPGLITTGGAPLDGYLSADVERVVVHELAHQWFYGTVASNEYQWPFLDEGLTTYVENRAMQALFRSPLDRFFEFWTHQDQRAHAAIYGQDVAIASSGPEYPSYSHLAALAYDRAALLLESCSLVYGAPFDQAFRAYARQFRQAHPTPTDFLATIEAHAGHAAAEALRTGVNARGHVNFVASELRSQRTIDADGYTNRVVLTRHGNLVLPVSIDIFESNRAPRREEWDGNEATRVLEFATSTPALAVCLDRDQRVTVEDARSDNCATSNAPSVPRYWGFILGWLQAFLTAFAW